MVKVPCLFWFWVEILLLRAFFRENLSATYSAHYCPQKREIQRFANWDHNLCENNKQTFHDYTNKLWDLSLYFWDLYNRWVLASQQKALGPCKCARFRVMQTYRNYSFSYFGRPFPPETPDTQSTNAHYKQPRDFHKKNAGNNLISTQIQKRRGTITTWHLLRSPKILCYIVDWFICYPCYMLDLRSM